MDELFDSNARCVIDEIKSVIPKLDQLGLDAKVDAINEIREALHKISPFRKEPVDFVKWVKSDTVFANDYNPNSVAPPEMKLLEHSIGEDGYTQPIVAWPHDNKNEVIDGFHRHRVGKESEIVRSRVSGYLPIAIIKDSRTDRNDRIAATIRHNRARGKHKIESMSDIVVELKRRNWSDEKISRELGMEQDEVLRLCQITGLAELFSNQEFSKAWDVEGFVNENDFKEIPDCEDVEDTDEIRTANTSDEGRIFHKYDTWECYKAGFYNTTAEGKTVDQCEREYKDLLTNEKEFSDTLEHIISNWKHSCEHYLTNVAMNRIAWLGQAALCHARKIPSKYRSGFSLLTEAEQQRANEVALKYLNKWLVSNGRPAVSMKEAYSGDRQSDIY